MMPYLERAYTIVYLKTIAVTRAERSDVIE
jgi:hypothetical protein